MDIKKEIEEFLKYNNLHEPSFVLGVKAGMESVTLDNIKPELVRAIFLGSCKFIDAVRSSGLTKQDLELCSTRDIVNCAREFYSNGTSPEK